MAEQVRPVQRGIGIRLKKQSTRLSSTPYCVICCRIMRPGWSGGAARPSSPTKAKRMVKTTLSPRLVTTPADETMMSPFL